MRYSAPKLLILRQNTQPFFKKIKKNETLPYISAHFDADNH